MAQLDGKIFKGILGNTILKNYRGKQLVQQKPRIPKSHMTAKTLKAADTFGVASKLGSYIRIALHGNISSRPEGTLVSRLVGELMECLYMGKNRAKNEYDLNTGHFSSLNGFEFNINSLLRRHLFARPRVSLSGTHLQVQLPELNISEDIKFIRDASYCKLVICVGMFSLDHGWYTDHVAQSMNIPRSNKNNKIPASDFNYVVPEGCLIIVGISLQYFEQSYIGDVSLNTKVFNPGAILAAYISEQGNEVPLIAEHSREMDFSLISRT
jgi:hypothetical protein